MKKPQLTPRNLTARTDRLMHEVVGNPVTTQLDSAIANCFPGLEYDVRTLECRFFPGLVFQYVQPPLYPLASALPNQQGAHLVYLDYLLDPMLPETSEEQWVQDLLDQFRNSLTTKFMTGRWYLDWIEQSGTRLSMTDPSGSYYEGHLVWRLVRGLEPDVPLTIGLTRRDLSAGDPVVPVVLKGFRRRYLDPLGIYDLAYRPGEFTQAMCNPWHHDFRDCACHYWASNHPDVVIRGADPADQLPNGAPADPVAAVTYVDWLRRREPSADVAAANTIGANRPYQIDHYEMNRVWETLPFVLEGQEIDGDYLPTSLPAGEPYGSIDEFVRELENTLAPLELTLAIRYLYALFSLKEPDEVRDSGLLKLADDLTAIRQQLLLIAVGEMLHLRWVNQILWEIDRRKLGPEGWQYQPILRWAASLPSGTSIPLLPLTPDTLDLFIEFERPTGGTARAYERCLATLKTPPFHDDGHLYELATRIDDDGIGHFQRFRNIKRILGGYALRGGHYPYLRNVEPKICEETEAVLKIFQETLIGLGKAYHLEAAGFAAKGEGEIQSGRANMLELKVAAEAAARLGFGVPFMDAKPPV